MGACGSKVNGSHAGGKRKKKKKKGSKHSASVAPLVHQIACIGLAHSGKAEVVRHFLGRIADRREAAERSNDSAVRAIASAWDVSKKKQGKPDYFGSPTFNVRVSNMPISLHDVPENKWEDGSEESHAYLWTMSGTVLVLDSRSPDLFAAARAALDDSLEARCPVLIILNNVARSKADAIQSLEALSRGFGIDAAPMKAQSWAIDIHYTAPQSTSSNSASSGATEDTVAKNTRCWCCGEGWPTTVGTEGMEAGSDAVELKDGDLPPSLQGGRVLTKFPPAIFYSSSPGAPPGTPHLCKVRQKYRWFGATLQRGRLLDSLIYCVEFLKGINWLLRTVAQGGTM